MKLRTHFAQSIRPLELALFLKKITGNKRTVLQHGKFKFFLDTWSNLYWSLFNSKLEEQMYEPLWTNFIVNTLQTGDTFIDLGANEGWFSIYAANKVGKKGKIFSIEPQNRLTEIIRTNASLNNLENITICNNAIALEPGNISIILSPSLNTGSSSIIKSKRNCLWSKQIVVAKRLEDLAEDYNISFINLIKIDIEGYELYALKSAENLLKQTLIKNILIDFHEVQLNKLSTSVIEIKNYLNSFGYFEKSQYGVNYFSSEV